jgi:hypothetical protein
LLAEEFVHDAVLNAPHQILAEPVNHRRVDARRHVPEGISGGHEAVMRLKILKSILNHPNPRQPREPLLKRRAHLFFGMHKPEFSQH